MSRAVAFHRARDLTAAAGACREILARQPGHAEANHLLGVIASQSGDQKEAQRYASKALSADARNPHFHNTLGNALHKQGRNPEAIRSFRTALSLDMRYADAWNNLGLALQASGEVEQAIVAYRRALAIAPAHAMAHNSVGNALVASGDLEAAIASYTAAIEANPRYHEAWSNRGNAEKLLGRELEALRSYEEALSIDPDDLSALNNRAVLLLEHGRHAEALPALESAAGRHPKDLASLTHLGVAYAGLRRYTEALACLEQVLGLDARYARAHYFRSHVLRARGEQEAALAGYLEAIACDPGYAEAFDGLAFTLLDIERYDDLGAVVDGIEAERCLTDEHRAGLRVITAIGAWVQDRVYDCQRDLNTACDTACAHTSEGGQFPNAAMIGIYRRYLSLLLDHRRREPQAYRHAALELHLIGESHCLAAAWTCVDLGGELHRARPHLVMGAKAWHFASAERNDHKQNLHRIVASLPQGAKALFLFGEIDSRIDDGILRHVQRHGAADMETIAVDTAVGYVRHVAALCRERGLRACFQGIPAPAIAYRGVTAAARDRHLYLVRFLNAALRTFAEEEGCGFIDVYSLSAGEDGYAHGRAHLDDYHLLPGYLSVALAGCRWPGASALSEEGVTLS